MAQARSRKNAAKATLRPQIRIMFRKAIAMGPGKADLLQAIGETGSISAAARRMTMSYRRAWLLVDTMNQCFEGPLVETATGGNHGGGARITELGEEVLRRYREMDAKASAAVSKEIVAFTRLMTGLSES
jgi:molybdate transport system regulatory protein